MCAKVFPQSWINDAKAEAGKTSEGTWQNCKKRSASPVATQIAELTKTVSTLAMCVAELHGSRQHSTSADQGGSGGDKAAKDRIAAIQAGERALAGFLDFGYGRDHPAVVQLEMELEQKRREHREGKPESAQVGAVAKKLGSLEKKNAKLEQEMSAKQQELDRLASTLQEMRESRDANHAAIRALRAEVSSMAGKMGSQDAQPVWCSQLSQQALSENPEVAALVQSPVFAKWHELVAAQKAGAVPVPDGEPDEDTEMESEGRSKTRGWEVMGRDELEALFAELRACPPDQVVGKLVALQLKRRKVG